MATALGNSLPTIIAAIRDNSTPVSLHWLFVAGRGWLLCSVIRYVEVTVICFYIPSHASHLWLQLGLPHGFILFPGMSAHASTSSGLRSSFVPPSLENVFVVGPGQAPTPAKLVSKVTSGQFVDLTDL